MNILKILRKPQLAIILASLFLFISCNQETVDLPVIKQSFNYDAYDFFKSNQNVINSLIDNKNNFESKSTKIISQEFLDKINSELNTNISYPDMALDLIDYERDEILALSLKQGWINQKDIELNNAFLNDLKIYGFDIALSNFENTVLKLELSTEKFEKLNIFANSMKALYYKNPNLFNQKNKSLLAKANFDWRCAGATIAVSAATASLISCATVVACGGAVLLHIIAIDAFVSECGEYL